MTLGKGHKDLEATVRDSYTICGFISRTFSWVFSCQPQILTAFFFCTLTSGLEQCDKVSYLWMQFSHVRNRVDNFAGSNPPGSYLFLKLWNDLQNTLEVRGVEKVLCMSLPQVPEGARLF